MKTYSVDLRERLLGAVDAGLPPGEAARLFGVGASTIKRWRRRRRETGSLAPTPKPGRPPRIAPAQWPALAAQVAAHPDATLAAHCDRWAQAHGVRVSEATMSRLRRRLGLPLKKSPSTRPSATRRPAPPGGTRPPRSPRGTSSSSTRRAPTPR
jgi:transposase